MLLSAAMRVRISDPALLRPLVLYFRSRGYLAVEERGTVSVVPLNAVSERADRFRFQRDLTEWQSEHPGVLASIEPD